MDLPLSGIAVTKIHTTITEGPQVGMGLTRINANVDPFLVLSFNTEQPIQNTVQLKNPLNVKILQ